MDIILVYLCKLNRCWYSRASITSNCAFGEKLVRLCELRLVGVSARLLTAIHFHNNKAKRLTPLSNVTFDYIPPTHTHFTRISCYIFYFWSLSPSLYLSAGIPQPPQCFVCSLLLLFLLSNFPLIPTCQCRWPPTLSLVQLKVSSIKGSFSSPILPSVVGLYGWILFCKVTEIILLWFVHEEIKWSELSMMSARKSETEK